MSLAQQRVFILGGSNGMGLALAQRLVADGAQVIIGGRSTARLDDALATLGGQAEGLSVDFTDAADLARAAQQLGSLDHLVLAASSDAAWGPFAQTPADALRRALEGKLIGYWQALQAMLPILRRDGSVLMLTGAASRTAMPGTTGLAAVNGAITQMAQTLALELAPLRVNVVSPGLVDTPAYDGLPAEAKRGLFEATAQRLPVGRTGMSDDVAAAMAFLLDNTFTTGALLDVDGGARMSR
ncbi:MAG: SDR family oxidoreductase [Paludibacterium sp.]|uniref:SDR family oxidoreductase n=1 Tax=Paludibacterium sp. TaxID=1917523 RepID=UPI0025E92F02|nr:SDR family oxidoreductase [Paludibacterium sp.]MBV8048113.1 SDR family oxidoreductase [Paludibacterium sp.]MBV8647015.1 SDR family oxidoreductase [Paludibacterium sp.]